MIALFVNSEIIKLHSFFFAQVTVQKPKHLILQ